MADTNFLTELNELLEKHNAKIRADNSSMVVFVGESAYEIAGNEIEAGTEMTRVNCGTYIPRGNTATWNNPV